MDVDGVLFCLAFGISQPMKEKEQTMIQGLIDAFDWGVLVSFDRQGQVLMNAALVEVFQIPDEVRYNMSYESQMAYVARQLRDERAFLQEVHDTEAQPLIETQELFHTHAGLSVELVSQPLRLAQLIVGRIWHFRGLTESLLDRRGATLMMKRRQELLGLLTAQTVQGRSPREILQGAVNQLGQVLAVDRVMIYQLDETMSEGLRFEWSTPAHAANFKDYYLYFQKNPWVWDFYGVVQRNHVNEDLDNPARKIRTLLKQLAVKTCLSFPIIIQEQLWGVLLLHCCTAERDWSSADIEFLEMLTNQLAIAISHHELQIQLSSIQARIAANNTTDELTLIPNARRFEQVLEKEWQRLAREDLPLTVLSCKIDFFEEYGEAYGEELARACLQQVSWAIALVCQRPADLVARCSTEEFGVILPNTDLDGALFLADQILTSIPKLRINHIHSPVDKYVTISIGINSIVPTLAILPSDLMQSAQEALKDAVNEGGNRIALGAMLAASDR